MRFSKAILVATSIIAIGLCTSGCSSFSTSSNSSKSSAQVSSAKKEEGSYRGDADGAAITLNSDGTGTYVMANPTQADIFMIN